MSGVSSRQKNVFTECVHEYAAPVFSSVKLLHIYSYTAAVVEGVRVAQCSRASAVTGRSLGSGVGFSLGNTGLMFWRVSDCVSILWLFSVRNNLAILM